MRLRCETDFQAIDELSTDKGESALWDALEFKGLNSSKLKDGLTKLESREHRLVRCLIKEPEVFFIARKFCEIEDIPNSAWKVRTDMEHLAARTTKALSVKILPNR